MNLNRRIDLLVRLGKYLLADEKELLNIKNKAAAENHWFTPEFIDLAITNIIYKYLQPEQLQSFAERYHIPDENNLTRKVGIVMAGNVPLVGFHDLLCVFISGHLARIKPSSKDEVLIKHIIAKMTEWDEEISSIITLNAQIPHCDAYIATGSNNSSRYFEYYFKKYPSIIRKNRTSIAILTGKETIKELELLSDDVYQYFGLGCRNVTKIYVPENYDFIPLLNVFNKYEFLANHHKYKNNYDYNLAIHILNNQFYMTNGSIILIEAKNPFSPISELHYEYYTDEEEIWKNLKQNQSIQCVVSGKKGDLGSAQCPGIGDYADQTDTIEFLMSLS